MRNNKIEKAIVPKGCVADDRTVTAATEGCAREHPRPNLLLSAERRREEEH
jgi:hypothetical protein